MSSQQDQHRSPEASVQEYLPSSRPFELDQTESSAAEAVPSIGASPTPRHTSSRATIGKARRGLQAFFGLGLTLVLLVTLGTSTTLSNDPRKSLTRDSFDRPNAAQWGTPDHGKPWMYPTGRSRVRLIGGKGVMVVNGRGRAEQTMLPTRVRDVTVQFDFSLDKMTGGNGVKVAAVLRRSQAGAYRARVRIGRGGRVWLSVVRVSPNGTQRIVGAPRMLPQSRYTEGKSMTVRAQVIKANPTQLRLMAWPTDGKQPKAWQLVRNDRAGAINAVGRVGLRTQITGLATRPSAVVRFDNVRVNRTQDAVRVAPTPIKPGQKNQPKRKTALVQDQAQPTPTPAPENAVNVPNSIDATGSRDVTAELRSVVNSAPDGSTIVFKAGGRYKLSSYLLVRGRNDLTLDGNGARLDLVGAGAKMGSSALIVDGLSRNVTIRDFTIVGNNGDAGTPQALHSSAQGQHGIAVFGSYDTVIEDVDIRRVWGDCLYLNSHNTEVWTDGLTFRDSTCRLAGRHGVGVIAARNVRVARVAFDEIGFMVVDIEPNSSTEGAIGLTMANNDIGSYGLTNLFVPHLLAACGADGSVVRDITVTGNTVEGNRAGYNNRVVGLDIKICGNDRVREDFTVTNNRAAKAVIGPVMYFRDTRGVTVTGNEQPLSSGQLATFPGSTGVVYKP